MTRAYYNEFDPFAARWLRNLIDAGLIAPGDVDERDIRDVRPADLAGYKQCHFFAGIGGWSYALRLAGWPDSRPVWTGSCPCQPFSVAGRQKGTEDERNLWPAFFDLIRERRPATVFGEQVASPAALGWWDSVQDDLEGAGYACGVAGLCSAGDGAAHERHRLYWVANTDNARLQGWSGVPKSSVEWPFGPCGMDGGLANRAGGSGGVSDANRKHQQPTGDGSGPSGTLRDREDDRVYGGPFPVLNSSHGLRSPADWLFCRDGHWRPVEPGSFPLADGVSARVGRLRACGNAIDPRVAAEFIRAYLGALEDVA